jgi:hypothetical protein
MRKRELIEDNNFFLLIKIFDIIKYMCDLVDIGMSCIITQGLFDRLGFGVGGVRFFSGGHIL